MKKSGVKNIVAIERDESLVEYDCLPPFSPPNKIYDLVIRLLTKLGDPLGNSVKPGNVVVIKPNLLKNFKSKTGLQAKITHPAVLRPIIDEVNKHLMGKGKIIICDTPIETADFDDLLNQTGLRSMVDYLKNEKGYPLEIYDLRKYRSVRYPGDIWERKELPGDPDGYIEIDLKDHSEFHELDGKKQNYLTLADHTIDHFDAGCESQGETNRFHFPGHHQYMVGKTILNADVIINMPKLKTHKKAGITLSLKNMIGIVPDKMYMPHHRPGFPPEGDSFPDEPDSRFLKTRHKRKRLKRFVVNLLGRRLSLFLSKTFFMDMSKKIFSTSNKDSIEFGEWYGNDTLWRTILDINKIVLYADANGEMHNQPQRKYLSIIDGIIGLEGEGPTGGEPILCGVLIGGSNPVSTDVVAARVMGFNEKLIPCLNKAYGSADFYLGEFDFNKIKIVGKIPVYSFKAPKGWQGHIERTIKKK